MTLVIISCIIKIQAHVQMLSRVCTYVGFMKACPIDVQTLSLVLFQGVFMVQNSASRQVYL